MALGHAPSRHTASGAMEDDVAVAHKQMPERPPTGTSTLGAETPATTRFSARLSVFRVGLRASGDAVNTSM
jgi:hypothetical protein